MSRYRLAPGPDVDLDAEDIRDAEGNRITDDYVDRAVAHVRAAQRRRGRQSLSGGSVHSPQVSFRVPAELREATERLANERGTSVSRLAREALEAYVRKSA